MIRLLARLLPHSPTSKATLTRSSTPSSAHFGKRSSKKSKIKPTRKITHSTVDHTGAELRIPPARLIHAWRSDQRGDTQDALKDTYAKWAGQLKYQNPTIKVNREFADKAVQQALPREKAVEHKKRGRPGFIEQMQQPLMAMSKALWEAEEARKKEAEARDAVEKDREFEKRKGR